MAPRKPRATMAADQTPIEEPMTQDSNSKGSIDWSGVFVAGVLVCLFLGTLMIGGAYAYRIATADTSVVPDRDRDRDDDRRRPDRKLVDLIEDARVSQAHAVYFAKVCDGVANAVAADGDSEKPTIDQRAEATAIVGNVGKIATQGNDAANYRRLPDAIDAAFTGVFPKDKDTGEMVGGELTKSDRTEYVRRWRELAAAFRTVAK
jgi:antirestriction protein ArdC